MDFKPMLLTAVVFFVVVPLLKAIWAWLTRDRTKEVKAAIPDFARRAGAEEARREEPDGEALAWWKSNRTSFVAVEATDGHVLYFDLGKGLRELRGPIQQGTLRATSAARHFTKGADGSWSAPASTVGALADSDRRLGLLYRPVWLHAMSGLRWGLLLGIAAKLLDTAAGLAVIDPPAALFFVLAIAVTFIPRVGVVGMVVASLVFSHFYRANFFLMAVVAAATGALLGCLPGMAAGGLVGLLRRRRLALAADAAPEPASLALKVVVLPLVGGGALLALYFLVIQPWAVRAALG